RIHCDTRRRMMRKLVVLCSAVLGVMMGQSGWASIPGNGTPGHVTVEVQAEGGKWVEVGQFSFNLTSRKQTLEFPSALAGHSLKVRLKQADNDETQYDQISLSADGKTVAPKALIHSETGESVVRKLAKADRDVIEMHGQTLVGEWPLAGKAKHLTLSLVGRSAKTSDIPA